MPWLGPYKEAISPRIGVVVERNVPFLGWASHIQQAYFDRMDIPSWTLERPTANPLTNLRAGLPPSDNLLRHEPIPWFQRRITRQDFPYQSTVLLKHHLKTLKLPTMTAECEKVAARCAKENVDHLGFLLQLSELELLDRERRAAARRLKAARFPTPKTLDEFDFTAAPAVNKPLVLELMRCEYISRRENVLLIGGSGTGKTHLATALASEACARGKRVRFFRVTELATLLLEAHEERQLMRLRSQLAKLDLLVLDELGYVPASQVGAELLFDVISTAYERSSVIVTTNLPFEEWTEVLGSERLTGATLDRLTHRCTILETGRESYRLKEAPSGVGGRRQNHRLWLSARDRAKCNLKAPGATFFGRPALRFLGGRHNFSPLRSFSCNDATIASRSAASLRASSSLRQTM